jgi:hypothetical protein
VSGRPRVQVFTGAAHQIAGQGPLLRPAGQRRRSRRCRRTSAKRSQGLNARYIRQIACAGFTGAAHQIAGKARSYGLPARGVGAGLAGERARSGRKTRVHGVSGRPHVQVLLALRTRSRGKARSYGLAARGVGAGLAGERARSGRKTRVHGVSGRPVCRSSCAASARTAQPVSNQRQSFDKFHWN